MRRRKRRRSMWSLFRWIFTRKPRLGKEYPEEKNSGKIKDEMAFVFAFLKSSARFNSLFTRMPEI